MDTDMMDLRLIGILCMTGLAIAALIVDGDMGESLMTGIVGAIGVAVGWMFGKNSKEVEDDATEVQE